MNWIELKKQQQEELAAYWKGRSERQAELQKEQQEALTQIAATGPKGQNYIQRMFREENEGFLNAEREELGQLLYAQQTERQNFFEKEVKRNNLLFLLNRNTEKDRGR